MPYPSQLAEMVRGRRYRIRAPFLAVKLGKHIEHGDSVEVSGEEIMACRGWRSFARNMRPGFVDEVVQEKKKQK